MMSCEAACSFHGSGSPGCLTILSQEGKVLRSTTALRAFIDTGQPEKIVSPKPNSKEQPVLGRFASAKSTPSSCTS